MKKLLFMASLIFISMSSFTNGNTTVEELLVVDCAAVAWTAGTFICSQRPGGCSEFQLWYITNGAYDICTSNNE